MEDNKERKLYSAIGDSRLLDIIVILDGEKVYEGMVEDAPEEIKKLKYSKIEMGNKITHFVYSELN